MIELLESFLIRKADILDSFQSYTTRASNLGMFLLYIPTLSYQLLQLVLLDLGQMTFIPTPFVILYLLYYFSHYNERRTKFIIIHDFFCSFQLFFKNKFIF